MTEHARIASSSIVMTETAIVEGQAKVEVSMEEVVTMEREVASASADADEDEAVDAYEGEVLRTLLMSVP